MRVCAYIYIYIYIYSIVVAYYYIILSYYTHIFILHYMTAGDAATWGKRLHARTRRGESPSENAAESSKEHPREKRQSFGECHWKDENPLENATSPLEDARDTRVPVSVCCVPRMNSPQPGRPQVRLPRAPGAERPGEGASGRAAPHVDPARPAGARRGAGRRKRAMECECPASYPPRQTGPLRVRERLAHVCAHAYGQSADSEWPQCSPRGEAPQGLGGAGSCWVTSPAATGSGTRRVIARAVPLALAAPGNAQHRCRTHAEFILRAHVAAVVVMITAARSPGRSLKK